MQLGMIGLGRMGASMVRHLLEDGHACVVHDLLPSAVAGLVEDRATGAESLKELVARLSRPRAIWLMVPLPDRTAAALMRDPERASPTLASPRTRTSSRYAGYRSDGAIAIRHTLGRSGFSRNTMNAALDVTTELPRLNEPPPGFEAKTTHGMRTLSHYQGQVADPVIASG